MSDSTQKHHDEERELPLPLEEIDAFLAMASKAGWTREWTGGNCCALTRTTPAGTYMISIEDDAFAPESDDVDVELGLYDNNEGQPLWDTMMSFNSTTAAMAYVAALTDKE